MGSNLRADVKYCLTINEPTVYVIQGFLNGEWRLFQSWLGSKVPLWLEPSLAHVEFSQFGLPPLITKNGVATDDEFLRREFAIKHLESLAQALDSGVDVISYLYWRLIDNCEWILGIRQRFGLATVDFKTRSACHDPALRTLPRVP